MSLSLFVKFSHFDSFALLKWNFQFGVNHIVVCFLLSTNSFRCTVDRFRPKWVNRFVVLWLLSCYGFCFGSSKRTTLCFFFNFFLFGLAFHLRKTWEEIIPSLGLTDSFDVDVPVEGDAPCLGGWSARRGFLRFRLFLGVFVSFGLLVYLRIRHGETRGRVLSKKFSYFLSPNLLFLFFFLFIYSYVFSATSQLGPGPRYGICKVNKRKWHNWRLNKSKHHNFWQWRNSN